MNLKAYHQLKLWVFPLLATLILGLSPLQLSAETKLDLNGDQTIPNIGFAKKQCKEYLQSGRYAEEIKKIDAEAKQYIDDYLAAHKDSKEKLAMVLDIDETSLSNAPHILQFDFAYIANEWDKWILTGKAPAIEATLDLYRYAQDKGLAIFFITGRTESERAVTISNLEEAGFKKWAALIMRTDATKAVSAKDFKTYHRKQISESGYHIIVNVGDQMSDFLGGYSDSVYKLPNPLYYVP